MSRNKKDKFHFKLFSINHDRCAHKVGTDGVLLGAWVDISRASRILDIGTGSGVIALMMAQRTIAGTRIDAIDVSADDCLQAIENVASSPWPEKIAINNVALQHFKSEPYDLIVSNPPYFIDSAKPPKEGRVRARHTASLSPLDLLDHSRRLLSDNGKLCLILPTTEANRFIDLATRSGWYCGRTCEFRARASKPVERLLFQLLLHYQEPRKESITLYDQGDQWTNEYKFLTKDFYLKI